MKHRRLLTLRIVQDILKAKLYEACRFSRHLRSFLSLHGLIAEKEQDSFSLVFLHIIVRGTK